MNFEPKSEEELDEAMLLPEGDYPFEVHKATDKTSSSGNEMIALELYVFDEQGRGRTQRDWLVASDQPLCIKKIRRFCAATGLMEQYESGQLSSDSCYGASGRCSIVQKKSEQYGMQNSVSDYIAIGGDSTSQEGEGGNVPF